MNIVEQMSTISSHSSHPSPGVHLGGGHLRPVGGEANRHWQELDHSGGGGGEFGKRGRVYSSLYF